jgi:hypothetical protein
MKKTRKEWGFYDMLYFECRISIFVFYSSLRQSFVMNVCIKYRKMKENIKFECDSLI